MDDFQQKIDYYNYYERQLLNATDISVEDLAFCIFTKSKKGLSHNLTRMLFDGEMDTADLFCMLLELVIMGMDILTDEKRTLFDIGDDTDKTIADIRDYFISIGLVSEIYEDYVIDSEIDTYNEREDYFCWIAPKSKIMPGSLSKVISNYKIIMNANYNYNSGTDLRNLRAFFMSNNRKIFVITFKVFNGY